MKILRILFAILTYIISNQIVHFITGLIEMLFGFTKDNLANIIVIAPFSVALYFFYKNFNLVYNKQLDLLENKLGFKRFLEIGLDNMKENMDEDDRKKINLIGLTRFLFILSGAMIIIMFFASGLYRQFVNVILNPNELSSWIFILNFIIFYLYFFQKNWRK